MAKVISVLTQQATIDRKCVHAAWSFTSPNPLDGVCTILLKGPKRGGEAPLSGGCYLLSLYRPNPHKDTADNVEQLRDMLASSPQASYEDPGLLLDDNDPLKDFLPLWANELEKSGNDADTALRLAIARARAKRQPVDTAPLQALLKTVRACMTSSVASEAAEGADGNDGNDEPTDDDWERILEPAAQALSGPETLTQPTAPTATQGVLPPQAFRDLLDSELFDQPWARDGLLRALAAREMGFQPTDHPLMMCLIGPPASGKTLLTQLIREHWAARPSITFNLATFQSDNEAFGLIGLRYGYTSSAPGRLTSFVRDHPTAIVVLKNFEHANASTQRVLLPLFSGGMLDDEFGFGPNAAEGNPSERSVDFRQAWIFFTTSCGEEIHSPAEFRTKLDTDPGAAIATLRESLGRALSPAFKNSKEGNEKSLSPLGGPISELPLLPFVNLSLSGLTRVVERQLEALQARLQKQEIALEGVHSAHLALAICLSFGPEINPKELLNGSTEAITRLLVDAAFAGDELRGKRVTLIVQTNPVLDELATADSTELLQQLFRRRELLEFEVELCRDGDQIQLIWRNFVLRRVQGSADYGGATGFQVELPGQRFADVVGHTLAKERLQLVLRLMAGIRGPNGKVLRAPKGMLMFGQPGTGKTLLARALAAEADLPFIAISGPELLAMSTIREVYSRARLFAPSIVFIDEIDALGVRGQGGIDPCINQLLIEIDGFKGAGGKAVFTIAATNFPSRVDPALTRSGRLDIVIEIPMLDREARRQFIQRLAPLADPKDWNEEQLLLLTAGMTGADLEKVERDCLIELDRLQRPTLSADDILEVINLQRFGQRTRHHRLAAELRATAFHEAGHAIVSLLLEPTIALEQVSIIARRNALGITVQSGEDLASLRFTRASVMRRLAMLLAGRIAQSQAFAEDDPNGGDDAGAASDLEAATGLALRAITVWGLDPQFGELTVASFGDTQPASLQNDTAQRVRLWLAEARTLATTQIKEHWPIVETLAAQLLEHETVAGSAVADIVRRGAVPYQAAR